MRERLAGAVVISLTIATASFLCNPSLSQSGATKPEPNVIQVPALQIAKVLMNAGRWQDARDALERMRFRNEAEEIERLFLLGLAEFRLGSLRSAARRFEAILARRPDLTRVRLELARVYHALGRDEKARFHFRASLADRLPSTVKDAVDAYLNSLDARKRWSASFSMSVLPESNPVKRTDAREVRIGGVPFRLNDDARAASGIGLFINTGGQYSPVIGEDWRGVLALSAAGKIYRNDDWNDISIQGDLGVARLFDRGEAAGGIRLTRRWLGGERYSTGIGPWARGRMRLSSAIRADLFLGAERRGHPERPSMDGWIFSLRSGLDYGFSARTSLRIEANLERNGARDKHQSSYFGGLALALSHAFEGGFSVSPRLSFSLRRHGGADPLFQKTRTDRLGRVSVNLLHRGLQYRGFAPYVGYAFEWNRSNIPINSYSNHGAVLGISRRF